MFLLIGGIISAAVLWWFLSRTATPWHARWNGWRDGRKGIPSQNQDFLTPL